MGFNISGWGSTKVADTEKTRDDVNAKAGQTKDARTRMCQVEGLGLPAVLHSSGLFFVFSPLDFGASDRPI